MYNLQVMLLKNICLQGQQFKCIVLPVVLLLRVECPLKSKILKGAKGVRNARIEQRALLLPVRALRTLHEPPSCLYKSSICKEAREVHVRALTFLALSLLTPEYSFGARVSTVKK